MKLITNDGPLPRIETPIPEVLNMQQIRLSDTYYSDALSETLLMQELCGSRQCFWDYQLRFRKRCPLSLEVSKPRILLHYMLKGDGLCLHKTGEAECIEAGYYYLFCVPRGLHDMAFPSGHYVYTQLELTPALLAHLNFPPYIGETIEQFLQEPGFVGIPLFKNPIPGSVLKILSGIKAHQFSKADFAPFFDRSSSLLINSFYEDLHKNLPAPPRDERELLVKEICVYIDGPEPELRTVPEICKKFLICPTTLRGLFDTYLHTTVRAYMLKSRMKKAKQFLITTEYSIQEIAAVTGYGRNQSFSTAFKKVVGESPLAYRKKYGRQ